MSTTKEFPQATAVSAPPVSNEELMAMLEQQRRVIELQQSQLQMGPPAVTVNPINNGYPMQQQVGYPPQGFQPQYQQSPGAPGYQQQYQQPQQQVIYQQPQAAPAPQINIQNTNTNVNGGGAKEEGCCCKCLRWVFCCPCAFCGCLCSGKC